MAKDVKIFSWKEKDMANEKVPIRVGETRCVDDGLVIFSDMENFPYRSKRIQC